MKKKMTRREDYLKQTYPLSRKGEVRGADLADALHLTQQGLQIAKSTLDKHGMLLALLTRLGVPGGVAAGDACAIEHNLSPKNYIALKQLRNERQKCV